MNSLLRSFSSGFLVIAFFGVSSAIAEELTNATASLALTNVPWPAGAKVSIPQFDPALGTLQFIKIELRSRARTFGTLLNLSTLDQTVFVTVDSSIAIRTGTRLLVEGQVTGVSAIADVPAGESTPSPTANGTAVRNGTVPNDFAAFLGTNTVSLLLSESTTNRVTGSSRVRYTPARTSAGADVTVTYTYQPLAPPPEFVAVNRSLDGKALQMTVAAPVGRICRLLMAPTVSATSWSTVGEQTVPLNGRLVFTNAISIEMEFFRAVLP